MQTKDEIIDSKSYETTVKIYNNLCSHYNNLTPEVIVPSFIFNMIFDEIKESIDKTLKTLNFP